MRIIIIVLIQILILTYTVSAIEFTPINKLNNDNFTVCSITINSDDEIKNEKSLNIVCFSSTSLFVTNINILNIKRIKAIKYELSWLGKLMELILRLRIFIYLI